MRQVLVSGVVAALVAGAVVLGLGAGRGGEEAAKPVESAYERVMRTGVLRCGYYMFKPMTWKDPNTGQMQGMAVDVGRAIEVQSGIRFDWVEEVTFGNMFEGLKTGRYDAICPPTWPDGRAARVAEFGPSWFYAGILPVVRADETRFKALVDFNQPSVRIVVQEGNSLQTLAKSMFPKATREELPANADGASYEQMLLAKKADVMFADLNRFYQFEASNPGKLKVLDLPPVQWNAFKMAVAKGEHDLNTFLVENIEALQNNGLMVEIMRKHEPKFGVFLPVARPF